MSSYFRVTKHPKTGKMEQAFWCDDYFGNHRYGVCFGGVRINEDMTIANLNKDVYEADNYTWVFEDDDGSRVGEEV